MDESGYVSIVVSLCLIEQLSPLISPRPAPLQMLDFSTWAVRNAQDQQALLYKGIGINPYRKDLLDLKKNEDNGQYIYIYLVL